MRNYIFKYESDFDNDFFQKNCFIPTEEWLPFCLNGDMGNVIGKIKLGLDNVGCYIEEYEFKEDDFKLPNRIGFGFINESFEYINGKRKIKKCKIMCLMNYEPIKQL
jgi:hypothetical protein